MNEKARDLELLRYLKDELGAEASRDLTDRLATDAALARRYAALRATWNVLEPPAEAGPAPSLAPEILDRARRESPGGLGAGVPLWIRAGAWAALPLGLALGLGLAPAANPHTVPGESGWSSEATTLEAEADGLAAAYYELMVTGEADDDAPGVS